MNTSKILFCESYLTTRIRTVFRLILIRRNNRQCSWIKQQFTRKPILCTGINRAIKAKRLLTRNFYITAVTILASALGFNVAIITSGFISPNNYITAIAISTCVSANLSAFAYIRCFGIFNIGIFALVATTNLDITATQFAICINNSAAG